MLTAGAYKEKADAWKKRLLELQQEIRAHESPDLNYLEHGNRILELAQRAHELCRRQPNNFERRKLVDLIGSKVVVSDGRVVLKLREPLSTLSKVAVAAKSGHEGSGWWAVLDDFKNSIVACAASSTLPSLPPTDQNTPQSVTNSRKEKQ